MESQERSLAHPALAVGLATILSGPVGIALTAIHAQPAWKDVDTFVSHFHRLQTAPYVLGFGLIAACVWFVACVAARAGGKSARVHAALVCTGAFAAIIGINYTLQAAFVPAAVRAHDPLLAAVAMANPRSLGWLLEMFGYGFFGVATWLLAASFSGAIARLFVANGVVSVAGAALSAVDPGWLLAPVGLASFVAWNVLLIAAMALVAVRHWPREESAPFCGSGADSAR